MNQLSHQYHLQRNIGALLIVGVIGIIIPYTILVINFNYPDILREKPLNILIQFQQGGTPLIFTWLAFALLGIPLLIAYSLLGELLAGKSYHIKWLTAFGLLSGFAQIIGLLRWVFVIPVLANGALLVSDPLLEKSLSIQFMVIHQLGGVLLGEHIGQLFTIVWSVGIAYHLYKSNFTPKWLTFYAYLSCFIYLLAQTELLATVIPDFLEISFAGFLGSTMWLVWLLILGIKFLTIKK